MLTNIFKKALANVLAITMAFSLLAVFPYTAGAVQSFVFRDNFEEETGTTPSKWEVTASKNNDAVITIVEEGGNKFLRYYTGAAGDVEGQRGGITTKDEFFSNTPFKGSAEPIIFKFRMRTSDANFRSQSHLGGTAMDCVNKDYMLTVFRGNGIRHAKSEYSDGSQTLETLAQPTVVAGQWYGVTVEIIPNTRVANFTFVDESNSNATYTGSGVLASGTFGKNTLTELERVVFTTSHAEGHNIDIDDVEVYRIYGSGMTAELLTDGGYLAQNADIKIKFSKGVDIDTLNAQTVVLKDANGTPVICTNRSYDERTKTYTLKADNLNGYDLIENNVYTVSLADGIYAGNAGGIGDPIYNAGILTGTKNFSFTVTRAASNNAYLSQIMVNGTPITNFDKTQLSYTVDIPYEENLEMPTVTANVEDISYAQTPVISTPTGEVDGAKVTITSTAEDGITKMVYEITFRVVGEEFAKLGTNLLSNPGFETGTTTGYEVAGAGYSGFSAVSGANEMHSGSYGAILADRSGLQTNFYKNMVNVKAGQTYLVSGWFRVKNEADEDKDFIIYPQNKGSNDNPNYVQISNSVKSSSTTWKQIVSVVEVNNDTSISPTILSWGTYGDHYVDDLYVGAMKPMLKYQGVHKVLAPESGNKEVSLVAEIVNQLGTKDGLENARITAWEIAGSSCGASISEGKLIVPHTATAGTITLKATFDPAYVGDDLYTDTWSETIEIEIFDDPELFPNAYLSSVSVNGTPITGFNKEVTEYTVDIPYAEELSMPTIVAVKEDADAGDPQIVLPTGQVDGATATVTVLAEDGMTSMIYKITFRVVGEELAKLGKNLLTNAGFENGNLDGYTWKPTTWHGLKLINDPENVHTGSYAALVENIENVQSHFYYNSASAGPNRTYLVSAWVKLKSENDNHKQFEMHPGSGTKAYRDEEYVSALKREWKQIITTIETDDAATSLNPMAVCWATTSGYYIDDLYVGELKPSLRYLGETEVEISATAEVLVDLKAEIVNQFGTANGLKYAAVTDWEIISDTYGVSIKDNDVLVISPDAEAGSVRIKATFDPAYFGDDIYTDVWSEVVEITLTDDGNTTPRAKGIKISGTVATGLPLSVDYRYYQVDGDPQSGSQIQWLWAETANGSYEEIPGAIGLNYTVESAYADKFISVKVLPKSAGGLTGVWTQCSSYLYRDTAPEAKDVKVTPSVSAYGIGDTLTGSYQYFDINGDEETGTSFRWLRYNDANSRWDAIAGATGKTYVLTEADIDKKLMFEVTPRAEKEPNPGALGLSREINGPSRPYVTNASFRSLSNNLLAASYTYHHPNGVAEGNTEIKWYVDGNYAGSGSSVTISSKGTKSICLEITPNASKEPMQGETVRVTGTVTGSSGNGGGGGGISSGGKVVSVPQLPSESEPVVPTEPTKHWASDAVAWAVAEGYMESADMLEGKLDTQMNREKFLTSVLKAVGLKPVEYRNEFADVADGEFAKLLQAAVDSGIISKYDNFYPQRSISREEICKIIVTAISAVGADANQPADIGTFTDNASIAEWAKGYVAQLVGLGILKGVSETEFMPKGNVTVAQTAIILQRIMDYMN